MGLIDRRRVLRLLGSAAVAAAAGSEKSYAQRGRRRSTVRTETPERHLFSLSLADDAFLDELEQRGCMYFLEQADPGTGQVLDRAVASSDGRLDGRRMSSVAATGFGLTALCIAHQRGYASAAAIETRVQRTLNFHAHKMQHEYGFFCHFNDVRTGAPFSHAEYSSIDTTLLLCGVLTARAYFANNPTIVKDATLIYERVEWPWMLFNGTQLFCMGWRKDFGFLQAVWNHYCELMMLPLLAMASPSHPVDPEVWDAWSRPQMHYKGMQWIGAHDPIFVHQYSHAWFDFRGRRDTYTNYFQNSVTATQAHRQFCLDMGAPYTEDYWGLSASDSEHGYRAWGGPPSFGGVDGSVVPCAAAGSLPFLPADCLQTLRSLRDTYGERVWGRYGFCDAFHPEVNWYGPDVLGIDIGISVLMAENLRTGFVWDTFMRNPEARRGMELAGFQAA